MTVHNFAWVCAKKLGLGEHEVRVVRKDQYICKCTFEELLEVGANIRISDAEILGVSMMLSTTKGDKPEYVTLISI